MGATLGDVVADLELGQLASLTFGLLLSAVWTWAAVGKLRNLGSFADSAVALVAPMSDRLTRPMALIIPPLEITLAVLVLLPATRTLGFFASAVTLSFFVAILARAERLRIPVGCACFGNETEKEVTVAAVVRTSLLAAAASLATGCAMVVGAAAVAPTAGTGAVAVGAAGLLGLGGALIAAVVKLLTSVEHHLTRVGAPS